MCKWYSSFTVHNGLKGRLWPFNFVDVVDNPPDIFISYQWDSKSEVLELKKELEKNHISCWMDVNQTYGGDNLQDGIAQGIKNAKVKLEDFCSISLLPAK